MATGKRKSGDASGLTVAKADHKTFIERLREMLGGRTARSFALEAGIPPTTFAQIIAGKTEPRRSTLLAITRAAGVSAHWLLTGEDPMRLSEVPDAPPVPVAHGWDEDLLRKCMIVADELVQELDLDMSPAEKAEAVLRMYRSELDRKVAGQPDLSPAEVVRLFRKVA